MGRRPLCLAALLFVFWILCTQVGNLEEKGGGLEARLTESGESRRRSLQAGKEENKSDIS